MTLPVSVSFISLLILVLANVNYTTSGGIDRADSADHHDGTEGDHSEHSEQSTSSSSHSSSGIKTLFGLGLGYQKMVWYKPVLVLQKPKFGLKEVKAKKVISGHRGPQLPPGYYAYSATPPKNHPHFHGAGEAKGLLGGIGYQGGGGHGGHYATPLNNVINYQQAVQYGGGDGGGGSGGGGYDYDYAYDTDSGVSYEAADDHGHTDHGHGGNGHTDVSHADHGQAGHGHGDVGHADHGNSGLHVGNSHGASNPSFHNVHVVPDHAHDNHHNLDSHSRGHLVTDHTHVGINHDNHNQIGHVDNTGVGGYGSVTDNHNPHYPNSALAPEHRLISGNHDHNHHNPLQHHQHVPGIGHQGHGSRQLQQTLRRVPLSRGQRMSRIRFPQSGRLGSRSRRPLRPRSRIVINGAIKKVLAHRQRRLKKLKKSHPVTPVPPTAGEEKKMLQDYNRLVQSHKLGGGDDDEDNRHDHQYDDEEDEADSENIYMKNREQWDQTPWQGLGQTSNASDNNRNVLNSLNKKSNEKRNPSSISDILNSGSTNSHAKV